MRKFVMTLAFSLVATVSFAQWRVIKTDTRNSLSDIHIRADGTGLIVGSFGTVLTTEDSGDSWTLMPKAVRVSLMSGFAVTPELFFSGRDSLYASTDAGENWHGVQVDFISNSTSSSSVRELEFLDAQTGFFLYGLSVCKTEDQGQSWQQVLEIAGYPQRIPERVQFPNASTGYVTGGLTNELDDLGVIFKTSDGGETWEEIVIENLSHITASYFIDAETGFFFTYDGELYYTADGGETWTVLPGLSEYVTSCVFRDEYFGFLTTYSGAIYKTTDGGSEWVQDYREDDMVLTQICMTGENKFIAIGSDGRIVKNDDFSTGTEGDTPPMSFELLQNKPNPFNPSTTISWSIASPAHVKLTVYDLLGREMQTLVDGFHQPSTYTTTLDASDFASGVYFYQLHVGENLVATRKMLLVR